MHQDKTYTHSTGVRSCADFTCEFLLRTESRILFSKTPHLNSLGDHFLEHSILGLSFASACTNKQYKMAIQHFRDVLTTEGAVFQPAIADTRRHESRVKFQRSCTAIRIPGRRSQKEGTKAWEVGWYSRLSYGC